MGLKLYEVDKRYIQHLKAAETKARGFTRVPDMEYPNRPKLACGAVLEIDGFKYYVGLTSYKIQKSDNILIVREGDQEPVKGSLRFNYMFPVVDSALKEKVFADEKDPNYRKLLMKDYDFIKKNEQKIIDKARQVYEQVVKKTGSQTQLLNSCDFKVLEQAAKTYSG